MKIGFTGTQRGMNKIQKIIVSAILDEYDNFIEFISHGDCIGADTDFHKISKDHNIKVIIHPPKINTKRAFNKSDKILPEDDYLTRNKNIVDSSDILIATPRENIEVLRSGTWSTIRYAIKNTKRL